MPLPHGRAIGCMLGVFVKKDDRTITAFHCVLVERNCFRLTHINCERHDYWQTAIGMGIYSSHSLYSCIYILVSLEHGSVFRDFIDIFINSGSNIWVRSWPHERWPVPLPQGRAIGCMLWVFLGKWSCYNDTSLLIVGAYCFRLTDIIVRGISLV